jgi:HNH endonuclease
VASWAGPNPWSRRLACDGTVTRVLVSRQPGGHDPGGDTPGSQDPSGGHPAAHGPDHHDLDPPERDGLQGRLRAAMALLPPVLGGAPSLPLEVGRATRVIAPAQRAALAARDGGCVFPDCDRPLAWCDAHHLWHWVDGGPTDLGNLALVCREHHRQVHEGGWQLARGPDGRFTATPGHRQHRAA